MQSCGKLNELLKLIATFECKKQSIILLELTLLKKDIKIII